MATKKKHPEIKKKIWIIFSPRISTNLGMLIRGNCHFTTFHCRHDSASLCLRRSWWFLIKTLQERRLTETDSPSLPRPISFKTLVSLSLRLCALSEYRERARNFFGSRDVYSWPFVVKNALPLCSSVLWVVHSDPFRSCVLSCFCTSLIRSSYGLHINDWVAPTLGKTSNHRSNTRG